MPVALSLARGVLDASIGIAGYRETPLVGHPPATDAPVNAPWNLYGQKVRNMPESQTKQKAMKRIWLLCEVKTVKVKTKEGLVMWNGKVGTLKSFIVYF